MDLMALAEFEKFDRIVVQVHDNPDPDAIASAFGLYVYFTSKNKDIKIVYGGRTKIQKANIVLMVERLNIPIEYVEENTDFGDALLITVDCQYGEGNVTPLKAKHIAIIDHHQGVGTGDYVCVYSYLGSCSTLIWMMMREVGFDFTNQELLCTAFYYGLITDTGNFMEIVHPFDRDMMDVLKGKYQQSLVRLFSNSNISLSELEIAGQALIHYDYDEQDKYLIIFSKPCDPNILGLINDLALQVDMVLVSVVYNELNLGYKLSIRSCTKEVKANELAEYLTDGIGSGGGHLDKAGGYIDGSMFMKKHRGEEIEEFLRERLKRYYSNCDIIYADKYEISLDGMQKYSKKRIVRGFVDPSSFLEEGTLITIRTLEGDIDIEVDKNFYIQIGLKGEVWPIAKEKFHKAYEVLDEEYKFTGEYEPVIHIKNEGKVINLLDEAKCCVNYDTSCVWGKELTKMVKIFTAWDPEKYFLGKPGDFLVCYVDDIKDVYVVERDIFFKTYNLVEE